MKRAFGATAAGPVPAEPPTFGASFELQLISAAKAAADRGDHKADVPNFFNESELGEVDLARIAAGRDYRWGGADRE